MIQIYHLPNFMDYLFVHYKKLYRLYAGRLTELFPSSEPNENNLFIIDEDKTSKANNELLLDLWKKFASWKQL